MSAIGPTYVEVLNVGLLQSQIVGSCLPWICTAPLRTAAKNNAPAPLHVPMYDVVADKLVCSLPDCRGLLLPCKGHVVRKTGHGYPSRGEQEGCVGLSAFRVQN